MKLDNRINSLSDILTCFDTEDAVQFKDKKGYFTNNFSDFADLRKILYGTLVGVSTDNYSEKPYCTFGGNYAYFLPEEYVRQEKHFRPFTIEEFRQVFAIGQPIRYKNKGSAGFESEALFMGFENIYDNTHTTISTSILIGHSSYKLDELSTEFEYKDVQGNWVPFGVKE